MPLGPRSSRTAPAVRQSADETSSLSAGAAFPNTSAWRSTPRTVSLQESYRSVAVPRTGSWDRKLLAFAGPGFLVAVGYMDPGNWATDLAAGSAFGYRLLAVVLLSSLMAIVLQALAARLGIATGRDLAQACRDRFSPPVSFALWVLAEIGICACDLAELAGHRAGPEAAAGHPAAAGRVPHHAGRHAGAGLARGEASEGWKPWSLAC
jgi:manganese transport protein